MRKVEQIMGLPVSVDIPGCENAGIFNAVFSRLREIDSRFSLYKPDSEVSRFRAGGITEAQLGDELKEVIEACREAEKKTDGFFSAWASDDFDPSGYVKGWAIAEAAKLIGQKGLKTYCIGAGGDILAASASEKTWQIAIQDPADKSRILNKLSIKDGAVATSGNYERGSHIINPKTKKPAQELLSVTIIGPDIIQADILATACFAMGGKAADFMKRQSGYEALIISKTHNRGNNR
jgi:FAD:protein FMN transferase